ncbi:hypothetical protein JMJ77_0001018 [Colletotrichum scovillei]|uniref:Uncharacterized protein n=1 Tax=Colletotrichum scovillei TaxID=1209932 RepID=A0A9P7RAG9_9PEZI|nr:hypothetical protein JMJ77_0001018 [Colletotrichum scovillei]KAG7072238.1 hypothetical protein JMJ76_0005094 [Colletotrichum scovillei]KAG7080351.1 hypothetical protein JMJ78_0007447 [Colletotrichum scovillei]
MRLTVFDTRRNLVSYPVLDEGFLSLPASGTARYAWPWISTRWNKSGSGIPGVCRNSLSSM